MVHGLSSYLFLISTFPRYPSPTQRARVPKLLYITLIITILFAFLLGTSFRTSPLADKIFFRYSFGRYSFYTCIVPLMVRRWSLTSNSNQGAPVEMIHFHLTLPRDVYDNLKSICSSRHDSMRSYIRHTLNTRIESEISGQKRCATGEICALSYLPRAPGTVPVSLP